MEPEQICFDACALSIEADVDKLGLHMEILGFWFSID
jgi:hypothetical protein